MSWGDLAFGFLMLIVLWIYRRGDVPEEDLEGLKSE
jgi:hypothetical protein